MLINNALFSCGKNAGIAVTNADLRLRGSNRNETKVLMGDPVIIHNIQNGGKFFEVETYNYKGYVSSRDIGKCTEEITQLYCRSESFAVAIKYFYYNGTFIRMGSRFPVGHNGELYMECLLPYSVFGMFFIKKRNMPKYVMHMGYVEYDRKNIINLAENALGMKYGWGDEGDGIDCSSFVGGVFRCMGIMLPRNVRGMLELDCPQCLVEGMEKNKITEKLMLFGEGCLLLTKSHVMIYSGIYDNEPVFIRCSNRMGGYCMKSGFGPYAQEAVKIIFIKNE